MQNDETVKKAAISKERFMKFLTLRRSGDNNTYDFDDQMDVILFKNIY